MRQIDEILWTLQRQPLPAQRYLLRRVERQPITADISLLRTQLKQQVPPAAADQARILEDDLFNRTVRSRLLRVGGQAGDRGQWTLFYGGGGETPAPPIQDERDLERAALQDFTPLPQVLEPHLRGRTLSDGLGLLSRVRLASSLDLISQVATQEGQGPACVAALANFGGEAAADRALELVRSADGQAAHSSMIAALRLLPSPGALEYLKEVVRRSPEYRVAVAMAVEGFPAEDGTGLLEAILTCNEPWPAIHCIETMGRVGGDTLADRLSYLFRKVRNSQVRVVCLQAAGDARDQGAAALVAEALQSKDPMVQAAAVEALVNLPSPDVIPLESIRDLVDSPHPKLAMNATLASALLEPHHAVERVHQFLNSQTPQELLKGVHCLSYLNYPPAATILASVVRMSHQGPMRLQAVRALGRRASRDQGAARELQAFLGHEDSEVRQLTACFLGEVHPMSREEAAAALAAQLRREDSLPVAVELADAIGLLAIDAGDAAETLAMKARTKNRDLSRAVGKAIAWGFPTHDAAEVLGQRDDPVFRALEALRSYSLGEGPPALLAEALAEASETEFEAVSTVACEVAEVAIRASSAPRLALLAQRLQRVASGEEAPPGPAPVEVATVIELDTDESAEPPPASMLATGTWWSARDRRSHERPETRARTKGVARARPGEEPSAQQTDEAIRSAFRSPAEEFQKAIEAVTYFGPSSEGETRSPLRLLAALAGGLGLLLLVWWSAGGGRSGRSTRFTTSTIGTGGTSTAPLPGHLDKLGSARERLLAATADLATRPSDSSGFDVRWRRLREWVALDPRASGDIISYSNLMKLRFRKLQGEEAALGELDGILTRVRARLLGSD